MVYRRTCHHCRKEVVCKVEKRRIAGSHLSLIKLLCPGCGRRLADLYQ